MQRGLILLACLAFGGACRDSGTNGDQSGPHDLTGADLTAPPGSDLSMSTPVSPVMAVTVIVEPSDKAAALVAAINAAQTSVHMTMYLLSSDLVIAALKSAHDAGRDVKVLLNQTFPSSGSGGEESGSNSQVYGQLQGYGIPVEYAPATFQYTHEKALVIDGTSAWIMTMNATDSSPTENREYLALDTDPLDVAETEAIFAADWAGTPITPSGQLLVSPTNSEGTLITLIDQATVSVDLEGEVLSADSILQALGRAQKRGLPIRIVLSDTTPSSSQKTALMELKQVSIPVHILSNPYVHAKAIVTDGKLAYIGSENFTVNSLESNRELGLVVGKQSEVDKIESTISADFAAGVAQ
jgi:phosphatidylserine/phosphatidylglycerophosphate/cardiolipin synthase-like enzyme